jgi:hypothetical protein
MPDAKAVLIGWLTSRPELSQILVTGKVPDDYDGSQSVVRITRNGGHTEFPHWRDEAYIHYDSFAPDEGAAWDLCVIVRDLLMSELLNADLSSFSASVTDVVEYVGPQWFDEDDYPPAGRYLVQMGVTLRPVS